MLLTHEPGDTEVGREVRQIVLDPATGELAHRTEALLYAADKAEHVDTVVLPALARGEVVVTDRYVDSALAYQGAGRDLAPAELDLAHPLGHRRPAPAPDRGARPRARARARPLRGARPHRGRVLDFHQRVREAFREMAAADPDHYLVLDARLPVDEIAAAGAASGSSRCSAQARGRAADRLETLVGQRVVADSLATAAGGHGMSQAWLFTGPPGSGRSNAAVAFAAALQCEHAARRPGCGACHACHTVLGRLARRRVGDPHREALDRRRRGPGAGPPRRPGPGRQALADPDRRGRRPAHRPGLQRAAQVHRGAHRPHRLDPLRAHRRGRPARRSGRAAGWSP